MSYYFHYWTLAKGTAYVMIIISPAEPSNEYDCNTISNDCLEIFVYFKKSLKYE